MKAMRLYLISAAALAATVHAQTIVPPNPGKSTQRQIGGGVSPGVQVLPREGAKPATTRYTTHITLSESRIWSHADGRTMEGKLIAFEDLVVETPQGATEPAIPPRPAKPTVVRNGKIRIFSNKKAFEIELSKLSQADQEFARQMEATIRKTPNQASTP